MDVTEFVDRWAASGGSERSNYALFLTELCDLLGVPHPDPASDDNRTNDYVFERAITFDNRDGTTSTKFADLYKRGCFVCETKQGVEQRDDAEVLSAAAKSAGSRRRTGHGKRGTKAYDDTMRRAHGQAEQYARNLAAEQGRPPFVMVIDVGHTIELYSEFSQTGGAYVPFPDPRSHRIKLADLADAEKGPPLLDRLRRVWTDPLALDPSRRAAKVTREIAASLAKLARALEADGHSAEDVSQFLMRCLFTMFADDVGLIAENSFTELLESLDDPTHFKPLMEGLWATMDTGGFNNELRQTLKKFNGGLFKDNQALGLNRDQLDLMIEAAKAKWNDVEPAIFGTLLERALDPVERHKLGAHYTPRAYVERLVVPTVVEPLREEWDAARVAAITHVENDERDAAAEELTRFHDRLCDVRVLDPACGSGNFLYVVLEHLKRIEGEVFATFDELCGDRQMLLDSGHTVDPSQLLGIEINPRAAAIAELVLWIGYLQWHFRTRGRQDVPVPVLRDLHNIECRDAVLAYDTREEVIDEATGEPVTIWDGRTTKPHPVTGLEVPDETARVPMYRYVNPRKAQWPAADFVVGNPPYIGARRVRPALGDGYVDAVRAAYGELPETIDFVMYWWDKAAALASQQAVCRFGFITTNSIVQSYSRPAVERWLIAKEPVELLMAVPNHPWVDAADGADVRVSMTVGGPAGTATPVLGTPVDTDSETCDVTWSKATRISPFLREDIGLHNAQTIAANAGMCFQGVVPAGDGFKLSREDVEGLQLNLSDHGEVVRRYFIGRDIVQRPSERFIIDCFGKQESEVRQRYPQIYQWLKDRVFPVRSENSRRVYRERWWIFAEPRPAMRTALDGLERYIATPYTAKFRPFVFVDGGWLPDAMAYAIASDDAYNLGTLSSKQHVLWSLSSGSRLGVGNDPRYTSKRCFFPFPFPAATDAQQQRIRELGEQLDAHRKKQQAEHPKLTMTGMYNVLEKLRSGETLTDKERTIHDQGLVSVLKEIHDELDAAVADAYGWPVDLSDEEILERLVALNHERAEEEKRGLIRWLRAEYQNPKGKTQTAALPDVADRPKKAASTKVKKQPWPKAMADQAAAVQTALGQLAVPADEADIAKAFTRAQKPRIAELLETLAAIGRARQLDDGRYVAA